MWNDSNETDWDVVFLIQQMMRMIEQEAVLIKKLRVLSMKAGQKVSLHNTWHLKIKMLLTYYVLQPQLN